MTLFGQLAIAILLLFLGIPLLSVDAWLPGTCFLLCACFPIVNIIKMIKGVDRED